MKTYKQGTIVPTRLKINTTKEGETIERKLERIVANREPITDGVSLIYTERKEGVRPSTNVRTDKFEIAAQASEKISQSYKTRRKERAEKTEAQKGPEGPKEDGKPESTQGK